MDDFTSQTRSISLIVNVGDVMSSPSRRSRLFSEASLGLRSHASPTGGNQRWSLRESDLLPLVPQT